MSWAHAGPADSIQDAIRDRCRHSGQKYVSEGGGHGGEK